MIDPNRKNDQNRVNRSTVDREKFIPKNHVDSKNRHE